MASASSVTTTKYTVELDEQDANTLLSVLFAVKWTGEHGSRCEDIYRVLANAGASELDATATWDEDLNEIVLA